MTSPIRALLPLALLCVPSLFAVPVTWTLTGVTLCDGGTMTGTFVYDRDTNAYSAIAISTTAGTAPATGCAVGGANAYVSHSLGSAVAPTATQVQLFTTAGSASGVLNVFLSFAGSLSNAGGTIALNLTTRESTCTNAGCTSPGNPQRTATAGTVVGVPVGPPPIPAPSSWLLMAVGLAIAGGGAWLRRSRAGAGQWR